MGLLLNLEDFASDGDASRDTVPDETLPGYDAGFRAGQAAAEAKQAATDAQLVQSIDDIAFGFAEARQTILQGLEPLFSALVTQVLPRTSEESFRAQLVQILMDGAAQDVAQPAVISVHPQQVETLSALFTSLGFADLTVHPDPGSTPNAALISRGDVETALDVDGMIARIIEILQIVTEASDERIAHG